MLSFIFIVQIPKFMLIKSHLLPRLPTGIAGPATAAQHTPIVYGQPLSDLAALSSDYTSEFHFVLWPQFIGSHPKEFESMIKV
jgi:hypothetical protein